MIIININRCDINEGKKFRSKKKNNKSFQKSANNFFSNFLVEKMKAWQEAFTYVCKYMYVDINENKQ